jgi:glycerol-3-phosphate dehydrogenase
MPHTRGVQVVPTTNSSVLLGPDAEEIDDPYDKATEGKNLTAILEQTERLVPSVTLECAIKTYAANRAACEETVRVRPDMFRPNLIHVGNRSTGVSASPGTADRVLTLLAADGLDISDRPQCIRSLPKVRRLLLDPDPETLDADDVRYRQVVCVCEQVTAAEIAHALSARVPARSIEGVRKRTRATAGRCQGSVCMAGVTFMCSLHTNLPPAEIRHGPEPATVGIASVR